MVLFGLSSTSHEVVVEMVVEPLTLQLLVVFLLTYPPSYFSLAKLFVPSFFKELL
jgi:hypothetical protein